MGGWPRVNDFGGLCLDRIKSQLGELVLHTTKCLIFSRFVPKLGTFHKAPNFSRFSWVHDFDWADSEAGGSGILGSMTRAGGSKLDR